jgi:hypothetical protein
MLSCSAMVRRQRSLKNPVIAGVLEGQQAVQAVLREASGEIFNGFRLRGQETPKK